MRKRLALPSKLDPGHELARSRGFTPSPMSTEASSPALGGFVRCFHHPTHQVTQSLSGGTSTYHPHWLMKVRLLHKPGRNRKPTIASSMLSARQTPSADFGRFHVCTPSIKVTSSGKTNRCAPRYALLPLAQQHIIHECTRRALYLSHGQIWTHETSASKSRNRTTTHNLRQEIHRDSAPGGQRDGAYVQVHISLFLHGILSSVSSLSACLNLRNSSKVGAAENALRGSDSSP